MANLLIVEDELNIRLLLEARLKGRYGVKTAGGGKEALQILDGGNIDLIITDIMMPDMDGYALVSELRRRGDGTPVIMLTAKETLQDKGRGFASGCDDYMTKPVNFEELVWRIDALLRRYKIANENKISIGGVTVDGTTYTVYKDGAAIELPSKEFRLLYLLLSYPDRIFTKEEILDKVWGFSSESEETTVRTHINRLRNKFENFEEFSIITVRGLGYKAVIKK